MVLPRAEAVHDVVTGGQDTVAIRVPSHPMAQQLLTAFGGGIAAPSANRYGRVSPTRAEHVREEFGDAVRVVLDGGESQIGLESTIVSFDGEQVRLLRPGFVTYSQLKEVVGDVIVGAGAGTPRVPGAKVSHYAPLTPMTIVPVDEIDKRAEQALRRRAAHRGARAAAAAQDLYVGDLDQRRAAGRTPTRTICTRICARSTRPVASRSWCRTCRATRSGPRSAIAWCVAPRRARPAKPTRSSRPGDSAYCRNARAAQ